MKVLVTGASGLLGRAVLQRCKEDGHEVKGLALTRASDDLVKLDLTDSAAVEALLREYVPDVIIHTAAERRPDVVEKNPEASQAINVDVPAHLARFCAGIEPSPLLINISTDYVFDGSKPPYKVDDEPNPLNAYGVSKLQGERAVKEHGKAGSVTNLRVPVLYGKTLTDDESAVNILVDAIVPPSDPSKQKKMDHYAVRYPTNVSDVARALSDLAKLRSASPSKEVPDTLHFSAMEAMTKYDMCNVLARVRAAGPDSTTDYLIPEDTVDEQAATARPRHCKLELSVIRELGIDTTCVGFEDWWRAHLEEQAELRRVREAQEAAEAERLRIEREAEEEKRRAEEEKRRAEEEAAAEQRRQVEEAAAKKPKEEEEAAAEEQRKKDEEAEEERRKEEQEASAKAAEEEAVRREKLASEEPTRQKESSLDTEGAEPEAAKDAGRTGSADDALVSSTVTAVAETTNAPTASGPAEVGSSSPSALAPLMSPTSPNPSFSSLQASRPTPPATSGLPSPTSSLPPAGPHSIFASDADLVDTVDSTSATTGAGAGTPPASAPPHAETNGAPPLSHSSTEIVAPRETPLFGAGSTDHMPGSGFGAFRDQADYFPGSSSGANAEAAPNDADSDGYGQPSPRPGGGESASTFAGVSGTPSTISGFEAGYGEVPFGLPDQSSQHGAEGVWGPGSEAVVSSQPVIQTPHGSGTSQEAAPFVPPPQPQEPKRPSFTIRVGDPQKVGDPVTAHIVYTVRTQTDSTAFRAQQFSVLRRYRDFRWLHAALVSNNPGAVVPPVPEKVAIGRFAPELVEARRHGLETCIQKITNHALLYDDPDLKLFLESDNFAQDVKLRDMEKGPVPLPDGSTKYFATWGSSIHGPKFYEFDEWFDTQKAYLDSLESQLKQLVKAVSTVSSQRKDLAAATSEFSHTLTVLSGSSLSRSLSTCFAGLGELEVRAKELTDAQAEADVRQIGNIMYEYERVVGSVRKAFGTRLNAWQNWHKTDEEARKLRSKHEKLKREGRVHPDRLHFSLQEIADAEGKALSLKRDFDNISMLCKAEMARFDKERVDDIRKAVEGWLDGMVTRQQELIGEWEHYMDLLNRQTGMNPQTGAQSNAARPASQGTA